MVHFLAKKENAFLTQKTWDNRNQIATANLSMAKDRLSL